MFHRFLMPFVIFLLFGKIISENCGDNGWVKYEDEKCFKVVEKVVPNSEVQNICRENGGVVGVIRSHEEQHLINEHIEKRGIVDNVWMGIKRYNDSFEWIDGTVMKYKNWAVGRPLNNHNLNCAVLSVDFVRQTDNDMENFGKWLDVNCNKKNAVLCEKFQIWSRSKIQEVLISNRKKLTDEIDDLKTNTIPEHQKQIDSQKVEIMKLVSNPVPIGFIYVQLSGQSEPNTLWPNTRWTNISPKYSGLFFRAEGGQSSTFGRIQEQQTESLKIYNADPGGGQYSTFEQWINITEKDMAKYIHTGGTDGWMRGIKLKFNTEEIRPRNQAIRIWQRTN